VQHRYADALTVRNTQRTVRFSLPLLRYRASRLLTLMRLEDYSLDVWVTTDATLRRLNKQYRGLDKTTDVLSFPFQKLQPPDPSIPPNERPLPPAASPLAEFRGTDKDAASATPAVPAPMEVKELGQLVLSAPAVARDARQEGVSTNARMQRLLVHGVCHLLGYDHETDADARIMEQEEKRLLHAMWVSESISSKMYGR
jgi:rRNA maturation RNase YbeY